MTFESTVYFMKYSDLVKSHNYVVTYLPDFQEEKSEFDHDQLYLDFDYDF